MARIARAGPRAFGARELAFRATRDRSNVASAIVMSIANVARGRGPISLPPPPPPPAAARSRVSPYLPVCPFHMVHAHLSTLS